MTDLENRLRDALRDLAEAVPESPRARADLDRRLAQRRRGRRRVTVFATAAAVLVLVALVVPTVVRSDQPGQGLRNTDPAWSTPRPSTNDTPELTQESGHSYAGPIELGTFMEDGVSRTALMVVDKAGDGERMCIHVNPDDDTPVPGAGCVAVPGTWPASPDGPDFVMTRTVLGGAGPDTGPLPNLLLFITAPRVATLEVRRGDGRTVPSTLLAESPDARFYLSDFAGPTAGFGYTAKDATGKVLETAIT